MNGKKAKLFRKLAGVNKENQENRSYHGEEGTVRNKVLNHPHKLNADGTPVMLAKYRTATYKLNQGARLLNKLLKKNYLVSLRNPSGLMVAR